MAGWFLRCVSLQFVYSWTMTIYTLKWWIQSPGAWFLVSVTRPPSFLRGSKDGNGESETEKRGLQALSCTGPRVSQPNPFPPLASHLAAI